MQKSRHRRQQPDVVPGVLPHSVKTEKLLREGARLHLLKPFEDVED